VLHRPPEPKQYTSLRFTEHLALEDIAPSIGTVGDAYDNALMECIIGLFKTECINTTVFHDGPYKSLADVEYATAGWVDWSRYAGDLLLGRRDRGGRVTGSIGDRPWTSYLACFAPLDLAEAS
jgi:hypothetical protein